MSVQVSTRVDEATKAQFEEICTAIGLSASGAISVFIKGVIHYRGIPFLPTLPLKEKPEKMSRAEMFGCMRGEFTIAEDFDAPLDDFEEYM